MYTFREYVDGRRLDEAGWMDSIKNIFGKKKKPYEDPFEIVNRQDVGPAIPKKQQKQYVDTHWDNGNLFQALQVYNRLSELLNRNSMFTPSQIVAISGNDRVAKTWNDKFSRMFLTSLDKPGTLDNILNIALFNPDRGLGIPRPMQKYEPKRPVLDLPKITTPENFQELVDFIVPLIKAGNDADEIKKQIYSKYRGLVPKQHGMWIGKAMKVAARNNLGVVRAEDEPQNRNILRFPSKVS